MSHHFSDAVAPLFHYLNTVPEIKGDEEAFELAMKSGPSMQLHHYPAGAISFSSVLPFPIKPEQTSEILWELMQVNLMSELSPPIVVAAGATNDEIIVWTRIEQSQATPEVLINLYERFAHYAVTIAKRLTV